MVRGVDGERGRRILVLKMSYFVSYIEGAEIKSGKVVVILSILLVDLQLMKESLWLFSCDCFSWAWMYKIRIVLSYIKVTFKV